MPAVSAMLAMLALWKPCWMKHCCEASRMCSRCASARAAASLLRGLSCCIVPGSLLAPAAPEDPVERDAIGLFGQVYRHQPAARSVQRALRIELGEVAVATGLVARLRQRFGL